MTEPFADEHAPEVAASEAAGPAAAGPEAAGPESAGPEAAASEAAEPSVSEAVETAVDPQEEIVDGLPVLAEVRTVERISAASLPAVQAAAAAATGFVAGAATVALVKRRAARKLARNGRGGPRRAVDMLPIVGSRSFLVDVHVIGKQGD
jgi:hypothetical protein